MMISIWLMSMCQMVSMKALDKASRGCISSKTWLEAPQVPPTPSDRKLWTGVTVARL